MWRNKIQYTLFCLTFVVFSSQMLQAAETETGYKTISDIAYYSPETPDQTEYMRERCKLDLYYPTDIKNYPTVVWFHGGGLKAGKKEIPEELKQRGIAIVAVNYRLYPKAKKPAYLEDAAAAVAWTFQHIAEYGGEPNLVFVAEHSTGGYL
ncbi:MAG: alpha/beta hydrolase, partial [Planctomycetaceae bacterium]|nr:alpha/beta hydrolase [Planctomycetaceae bacterium]